MLQTELISGFSELKDLLIRTYKVEKERSLIRLFFTEKENQLFMHDYNDHEKTVLLVPSIKSKKPSLILRGHALNVIAASLKSSDPTKFLNEGFILYGFFRF